MCNIVFEKAKGRGGTVNRTNVFAEAAVRMVLSKRYDKFKTYKKTSVLESLF